MIQLHTAEPSSLGQLKPPSYSRSLLAAEAILVLMSDILHNNTATRYTTSTLYYQGLLADDMISAEVDRSVDHWTSAMPLPARACWKDLSYEQRAVLFLVVSELSANQKIIPESGLVSSSEMKDGVASIAWNDMGDVGWLSAQEMILKSFELLHGIPYPNGSLQHLRELLGDSSIESHVKDESYPDWRDTLNVTGKPSFQIGDSIKLRWKDLSPAQRALTFLVYNEFAESRKGGYTAAQA